MKLVTYFLIASFLFASVSTFAQDSDIEIKQTLDKRGEVLFSFAKDCGYSLDLLSRVVSIDKIENGKVYAYANKAQWQNFAAMQIPFRKELSDGEKSIKHPELYTSTGKGQWDSYPSYSQYVSILTALQTAYPSLCKLHSLGTLASGREIFALQLGDSVSIDEAEPQFLYTSTMHGDETTGWILLMRLAEHLLSNYGTDSLATYLMNNVELWICPNTNPDGTYYGGNSSVVGARRYNANSVDLNRNFQDPEDGDHPDNNAWQPETMMMMGFADSLNFTMASNLHGGYEVVNYPWDTWARLPADNAWWIYVSRIYADSAHANSPSGYMTSQNNGITNGYAWYSVAGGRQDYMNYWHQCREMILEISNTKLLPDSLLDAHWDYNKASLLRYMEQVTYGLTGKVTDSISGLPLKARVEILAHDIDSSHVYTHPSHGDYYRLLDDGTYSITYSSAGYVSKTIVVTNVSKTSLLVQDVQLVKDTLNAIQNISSDLEVKLFPNPTSNYIHLSWVNISTSEPLVIELFDMAGKSVLKYAVIGVDNFDLDVSMLTNGNYLIRLIQDSHTWSSNIQKL